MSRIIIKILLWLFGTVLALSLLIILGLFIGIRPAIPKLEIDNITNVEIPKKDTTPDGLIYIGDNKLRQNKYGLFELYVEGDAFERGLIVGALSQKLVKYQEEVFIEKINEIIPSKRYRDLLQTTIIWFNARLHKYVHPEFIREIYGISFSASREFESYGPAFYRLLNYHAAHDIGHTLQAYSLVGCTSFSAWGRHVSDSTLLSGRNFDFYFGKEFAENKIVQFVAPEKGNKFAFVTWGGMTGAVSGMNQAGLAITINAGTPSIAKRTGTPVSLLAREILQFASNIDQALEIASQRRTFVSESFLVSSAEDKMSVIIEKTPYQQEVVEADSELILCTNHYQGKMTGNNKENELTKKKATGYRFELLQELIAQQEPLTYNNIAEILRNKEGKNGESLGFGNEMAVNQLLAHHSVIFDVQKRIMWVSGPPNVLGPYVAYNLNSVIERFKTTKTNEPIDEHNMLIAADTFLITQEYKKYSHYKQLKDEYFMMNFRGRPVEDSIFMLMITLNPEYFETYILWGDNYVEQENWDMAIEKYSYGLTKKLPISIKKEIEEKIIYCKQQ